MSFKKFLEKRGRKLFCPLMFAIFSVKLSLPFPSLPSFHFSFVFNSLPPSLSLLPHLIFFPFCFGLQISFLLLFCFVFPFQNLEFVHRNSFTFSSAYYHNAVGGAQGVPLAILKCPEKTLFNRPSKKKSRGKAPWNPLSCREVRGRKSS